MPQVFNVDNLMENIRRGEFGPVKKLAEKAGYLPQEITDYLSVFDFQKLKRWIPYLTGIFYVRDDVTFPNYPGTGFVIGGSSESLSVIAKGVSYFTPASALETNELF